MKIELQEITIREVVNGYMDNAEAGVVGYDGKVVKYKHEDKYKG